MRSEKIKKILKEVPLEIRVKNVIEAHYIINGGGCLICPLDENGNDIPSIVAINQKCLEEAQPIWKIY